MSARQLREAIKVHRQTKRELTYLSKKCLQNIGGRLQPGARVGFVHMPGAASGAAAEQQRGAGGALPPFPNFEPISDQQLKRFKLDRLHNGVLVVLKQRGEPPAATWHYVVPAEDLDSFLLSLSLAGLGINRAFDKVGSVCSLLGLHAGSHGRRLQLAKLPAHLRLLSPPHLHLVPCTHCPC